MRSKALAGAAVMAALLITGCSADADDGATTGDSSPVAAADAVDVDAAVEAVADGAVLIDVRTPEEYAEGHVEGALNIDVTAPDFAERIGELDPAQPYVVYCRSGNRSANAIATMRELGFTDLVNGGAFADLADAGLPRG